MTPAEPEITSITMQAAVSVPSMVYPYRAGVIGGALGGLAMVLVAALYGFASGFGPWLPVNLIGATLVRNLQSATIDQLVQFSAAALIAGLVLHAALSIGLGYIFALLLPTCPGTPIVWALTIGPLLWAIASVLTLPLVNPVMAQHVDRGSFFIAHVVYGLVLGGWIARTPKIRA